MEIEAELVKAARLVAQTDLPREAADALLRLVGTAMGSSTNSLWLLDRGSARFRRCAPSEDGRFASTYFPSESVPMPDHHFGSSGRVARFSGNVGPPGKSAAAVASNGTVVVGRRGSTIIGFLLLEDRTADSVTAEEARYLDLIAQLLVQIYNRDFAHNHLGAAQQPLSYHTSEREFFDSLILQLAESARMQFVALREYDARADRLNALALWGFDDLDGLEKWDLSPVDAYPPFAAAVRERNTIVAPSMAAPEFASLRRMPELDAVRSFVAAPIIVGNGLFGVLSVAASCEYEYNSIEIRAFQSIAGAAGLAIQYFRVDHTLASQVRDLTEASSAITTVEIAHAARHEAVVKIANARRATKNLEKALGDSDLGVAASRLEGLKRDHLEIEASINKIRLASNPRNQPVSVVDIKQLWEEARNATHGKLGLQRVDFRIDGPSQTILARSDQLRQVFMNLLLNSADAFADGRTRKREKREVVVRIGQPSGSAAPILCTYRDTAGGLQITKLKPLLEGLEVPLERAIFEKGVTTKPAGTGYGLWLANRLVQKHDGSIRVVSNKGGLMFEIELPHPSVSRLRSSLEASGG